LNACPSVKVTWTGYPRELRELAGERAEERDDEPDLFGVEVPTVLVPAHQQHRLLKRCPLCMLSAETRARRLFCLGQCEKDRASL
jgi:hypothetical protein